MQPLIVTVAAVGAELTRDDQPNLPIEPGQVAEDAARCREAGASIYHLHVRDPDGAPTMSPERFAAVADAIAASCDVIVQFTTGGAIGDPAEARLAHLSLRPEMATLTTGSVNFGEDVFLNPLPLVRSIYERMLELSILPEFEIFEAGMIATAERLYASLGAIHHRHFDFVLGVPGAMPAWDDAAAYLAQHLPDDATWSATGIGRSYERVARAAIALGGHVRTGLEDVLYVDRGIRAASNEQLVEKIVVHARNAGREVATPAVVRELFGLGG